jgi:hypothetical protein
MKVSELKNYGVEMNLMFQKIPDNHPEIVRKATCLSLSIIRKKIGLFTLARMFLRIRKEQKRIGKIPFPIKEPLTPKTARMLEKSFSGKAAMFCALAWYTGNDAAMEIMKEIMAATAYQAATTELPEPVDFAACGDAFAAFREYILEMFRVNKGAGIHDYRILECNDNCLEFDITYCAIHEYMKIIAPIEACMANCYGDDILFPEFCRQIGTRFMRKGNMACGYSCCNTRYERVRG